MRQCLLVTALSYAQQNAATVADGSQRYFNYQAFATGTYPLFAYTTDPSVPDDGCVVPEGTPDLAGKLVIVRRGGCSLSDKARNAYIAGATAIFVVKCVLAEREHSLMTRSSTPDTAPLYQNFVSSSANGLNIPDTVCSL